MRSPRTLIVVMAHGGAQATFNRHLRYWQAHANPILTFCPSDDLVVGHGTEVVSFGRAGHHDVSSIERFKYLLKLLSLRREDYFVIMEYDSLCLSSGIPPELFSVDCIFSNLFHDIPGNPFSATHFLHPPLVFSKKTLSKIVSECERRKEFDGLGYWDRYLGQICESGNIEMRGYGKLGFSVNTIEPSILPAAIEAVAGGAVMIHGIKTEPVLSSILSRYDSRPNNTKIN